MLIVYRGIDEFGTNAGGWINNNLFPRFVEDITGDGRADIVGFASNGVWTSTGDGTGTFQTAKLGVADFGTNAGGWINNNLFPRFVEDITGDGRADIVGFASNGVWTSIGDGTGTFLTAKLGVGDFGTNAGGWINNNLFPRFVEDITGDNRADIVGFASNGVWTSTGDGTGTFQTAKLGVADFGTNAGGWINNDIFPRFVEDITGDGRADIVGFASNGVWTSISNGDGTFQTAKLGVADFGTNAGGWLNNNLFPRFVEDITGDGRADIVGFASNGVWTSIGNGDGTFQTAKLGVGDFGTNAGGWINNNIFPRFVEDITGDNRADIVGFASNGVWTSISDGTGTFQTPELIVGDFGTNAGGWTNNDLYPRFVEDITGDGRADIVGFWSDGVYDSMF